MVNVLLFTNTFSKHIRTYEGFYVGDCSFCRLEVTCILQDWGGGGYMQTFYISISIRCCNIVSRINEKDKCWGSLPLARRTILQYGSVNSVALRLKKPVLTRETGLI